jgi:N-acetylglucosamine-6-phosphate deacetylase
MLLKNATLVNHDSVIKNGYIRIEDGRIVEVGTECQEAGIDMQGHYILPGFIDIHIHGTNGVDVMDGTKEALDVMTTNLVKEGTTSFLPTTLTMSQEKIKQAIKNVIDYEGNPQGSRILGIHLEGPYVDKQYKGAQNEKYIQQPTIPYLKELLKESDGQIKIVTYACEKATFEFTNYLVKKNIIPSVGHSSASMKDVIDHVKQGLQHATHFHNGQSPHHHRNPGVVSAGFYSDDLFTEVIVDGVHVHPDVVKMIHKLKSPQRILLVTDSMRAKGLENGPYTLGGLDVVKTDNEVRTTSGSLAGSILKMSDAVKNMLQFTNCKISEIVSMTSFNQAKQLKIEHELGSIKEGYIADLVVLNESYELIQTIRDGLVVYSKDA